MVMVVAIIAAMVVVIFHRGAQAGGNAAWFCMAFGQGFDCASKQIGFGGQLASEKACKPGKGDGAGGDSVDLFVFGSAAHVFQAVEQAGFKDQFHIGRAGRILRQRSWSADRAGQVDANMTGQNGQPVFNLGVDLDGVVKFAAHGLFLLT
jgi:hypothetical protein